MHEVAEKLKEILKSFGMDVECLRGVGKQWEALDADAYKKARFLAGGLVLVIQAHHAALNLCADLLEANGVHGAVVILDEADNFFSNSWKKEGAAHSSDFDLTKAEQALSRIVGTVPLGTGSRARSFLMVSATHLATKKWLGDLERDYRVFVADLEALKRKGYALERHLKPMWFVEPAEVTFKTDYGFDHPKMKAFFADVREPGPGKTGVLALVATSPRVFAAGMNSFNQAAETVTSRVPNGVAIVVCGQGVFVASRETQPEAGGPDSKDGCPLGFQRMFQTVALGTLHAHGAREVVVVKRVHDAIKQIDRTYGLARPVIVFGYNLVGRSFSCRSSNRVLTHLAVVLQKGKTTADLRQTFMRGAGLTLDVRERNGFGDGVRLLCVKEDYEVIMEMFNFTADVLRMEGPANNAWLEHQEYPRKYRPILQTQRPTGTLIRALGDSRGIGVSNGLQNGLIKTPYYRRNHLGGFGSLP